MELDFQQLKDFSLMWIFLDSIYNLKYSEYILGSKNICLKNISQEQIIFAREIYMKWGDYNFSVI